MQILERLREIRSCCGKRQTEGLPDEIITRFAGHDPKLVQAVEEAHARHRELRETHGELLAMGEVDQVHAIQEHLLNFYPDDAVNPYVSLAARGPWLVTTGGAVLHDNGGYGMLGMGHAPDAVIDTLSRPHVMANVMTANLSQLDFIAALESEIGHTRGGCPYHRFLCMNSGSEAVTVAARIADISTRMQTDPGQHHQGKAVKALSLAGGFHGRTERPAQYSDSTRNTYRKYLASFRDRADLLTVAPNDLEALRSVFQRAEAEGWFIEAMFMEPVMGEGNPGMAVTPEFYHLARELTEAHGSLLLVDSIQAGLRATGCLSIVDYPGFEQIPAPDMETYSKALNGGQYPLSVLAMNERAAGLYRKGVYGNTMTTAPRAMEVGTAVLSQVTDELRENIRARGREFLSRFRALADELDGPITRVQGTGLLFSCELDDAYKCYGEDSTEEYLRKHGIGVIHGGRNSLRFTPHFAITGEEVDLVVDAVRDALVNGPRRSTATGDEEEAHVSNL